MSAQAAETYTARLGITPVDATNQPFVTGSGTVTATLQGTKLAITGSFTGLQSPATIAQTLRAARERYDIELPLADLFTWGTDSSAAVKLTSGFLVRPETVQGRPCNHYAFRQENVDWQIWIAEEGPQLPCKLVITDKQVTGEPSFTVQLREWDFAPRFERGTFTFEPPPGVERIDFRGDPRPAP